MDDSRSFFALVSLYRKTFKEIEDRRCANKPIDFFDLNAKFEEVRSFAKELRSNTLSGLSDDHNQYIPHKYILGEPQVSWTEDQWVEWAKQETCDKQT
jgi:hypothetical protein